MKAVLDWKKVRTLQHRRPPIKRRYISAPHPIVEGAKKRNRYEPAFLSRKHIPTSSRIVLPAYHLASSFSVQRTLSACSYHSPFNLAFRMHFLQGKDQDQSQLTQGQATFLGEFVCETLGLNYLLVRFSLWRINHSQRQSEQTYAIPDCVTIISASVSVSSKTIIVSACEILLVNSGSAGRAR